MRHTGTLVVLMGVVLLGAAPAWAARTRMHELAESPAYKEKAGGMIGRGLLNAVTFFVDPLVHIVNETKAGPPLVGTLRGVATGVSCGVLRFGSGAVDIVTFWVPGFNGFPVSDSYENCLAGPTASSGGVSVPSAYPNESTQVWTPVQEPSSAPAAAAEPPKQKYYKK